MLNVLKTLANGILEKAKTFKSDWNENDPSSPNYVKNRTHWVDGDKIHKLDKKFIPKLDQYVTNENMEEVRDEIDNLIIYLSDNVYTIDRVYTKEETYSKYEMARVATTGEYKDLNNIPYGIITTDSVYITIRYLYDSYTNNIKSSMFDRANRDNFCNGGLLSFELASGGFPSDTVYVKTDYIEPSYSNNNCYIYGNAYLYNNTLPDSGENWFVDIRKTSSYVYVYREDKLPYYLKISERTTEIRQLDERCIPDTIARVEDIPEATCDWNVMENKPTEMVGIDTLTWDGNIEGLENVVNIFYKVSDATPTMSDINNGFTIDLYSYGNTLSQNWNVKESGGVISINHEDAGHTALIIVPFDNAMLEGVTIPTKGVYFYNYANDFVTKSFVINGYNGFNPQEKIKEKYLPNTGGAFVVNVTVDSDGNITSDKSYEEISDVIKQKKNPVCILDYGDGTIYHFVFYQQYEVDGDLAVNQHIDFTTFYFVNDTLNVISLQIQATNDITVNSGTFVGETNM